MNRPGDLLGPAGRLKRATAELQHHWVQTQEHWNDASAREFESNYLAPLLPALRLVLSATSELDEIYRKAVAACHDEQDDITAG